MTGNGDASADQALCDSTAVDLAMRLRAAEISVREVIAAHIARVEAVDGPVNALVTRTFERAWDQAGAADDALARGEPAGLLHGLPVAHKDLADTAGVRTTYGSPIFADHVPTADALHVARMRRAGAISLGKTNTPEFGAGSQTFNTLFGSTKNPYDLSKTSGGSSGGAAAALATGQVALADGGDMGGSLRNPASFCNVVGLRPSPGRVPSWPSSEVWSPLSVVGPMGRTVADAALLLAAISGSDPRVPLALEAAGPPVISAADVRHWLERGPVMGPAGSASVVRVAWSENLGGLPIDARVRAVLSGARTTIEGLGWNVDDREPDLSSADEVFRIERALSFASRFGGLLADHRHQIKDSIIWNTEQGLALTVADVIRAGARRAGLARSVADFFEPTDGSAPPDVLAGPVSAVPPFDVDEEWVREVDGVTMHSYIEWMATASRISATGLPAVSVPAGFTPEGLPVGIQLVGRHRGEWELLRVAHAFEQATGFGQRRPPRRT